MWSFFVGTAEVRGNGPSKPGSPYTGMKSITFVTASIGSAAKCRPREILAERKKLLEPLALGVQNKYRILDVHVPKNEVDQVHAWSRHASAPRRQTLFPKFRQSASLRELAPVRKKSRSQDLAGQFHTLVRHR
jgi:hypothetical protein